MRSLLATQFVIGVLVVGCGDDRPPSGVLVDAGRSDSGTDSGSRAETLMHAFPAIDVAPGQEISWQCQTWTLGNAAPLYVNRITADNGGAWHHSNWFFVREGDFAGPDGTWGCGERGFGEIEAAALGGVFFAQSTQSPMDVQAFPPGVALRIPPRAKIVGDVHLLNAGRDPVRTAMEMTVDTLALEDVQVQLAPLSFTNNGIDLPPRQRSEFELLCEVDAFGDGEDFDVYYVLPHFHSLGTLFRLEAIDAAGASTTIVETFPTQGESWGIPLDPPVQVRGAVAVRATCGYDNPRDERVVYGIGDQEMCVFLAYTDSRFKIGARGTGNEVLGDVDGVSMNRATDCQMLVLPR